MGVTPWRDGRRVGVGQKFSPGGGKGGEEFDGSVTEVLDQGESREIRYVLNREGRCVTMVW